MRKTAAQLLGGESFGLAWIVGPMEVLALFGAAHEVLEDYFDNQYDGSPEQGPEAWKYFRLAGLVGYKTDSESPNPEWNGE